MNTHRDPKDVIVSWTKFQVQMLQIYHEEGRELAGEYARMTKEMVIEMILRVMRYREGMDQEKGTKEKGGREGRVEGEVEEK